MNDVNVKADAKTYRLQSASWPRGSAIGTPEDLCFRASPRECWSYDPERSIRALPTAANVRQILDCSTYFGAFSLTTWCGVAGIDTVIVSVRFSGICTMKVYEDNGYEGRSLLWERQVSGGDQPVSARIDGLAAHRGILFPVFEVTRGDAFELFEVDYLTDRAAPFAPRLAIVMPTFRREAYALRNIRLIVDEVLPRAGGSASLFVIDNGQTLVAPEAAGLTVIPNRNFGGAGGFARGVLEASAQHGRFSHSLFCDDDVLIDPQSILRLVTLLGYLPQDRIVSGGMLKMGQRHILHEKSANVVGMHFSSNRGNEDLTGAKAVARHDESGFSSFCGWWFVCYPLASGKDSFLPFPFFVGWDDVEMGKRCNQRGLQVVSLLGIGVWHEEFEKKDVTWRWYYHVRNGLATSLLYDNHHKALGQAILEIMTALLTYRYERAEYMIDGLAAVADGSRAIREQPADELHGALLRRQQTRFVEIGNRMVTQRLHHGPKASRLRAVIAKLTMNGHLLPRALFKRADTPADPGWAVEPLHSNRLRTIFRCPKVVYYEPISGKGMICEVDHGRYYRLLGRMLWQWLRLRLRWSAVRRDWRASHDELTSRPFWTRYLGLQQTP